MRFIPGITRGPVNELPSHLDVSGVASEVRVVIAERKVSSHGLAGLQSDHIADTEPFPTTAIGI